MEIIKMNPIGYFPIYLSFVWTSLVSSTTEFELPKFIDPVQNITARVNTDVTLPCIIDKLKNYQVAFARMDTQTVLSIGTVLITRNARITISNKDKHNWYLHIRDVQESDSGWYMCQINTNPMRSSSIYLQVVVPPTIEGILPAEDVVVREGLNVTLECLIKGIPQPYVMWRREDGNEILINGENVNVVDGELLSITKISRLHMGSYLCIAANGVPPSISKRVQLKVQFPPMITIPNQLEGAFLGQDVKLKCEAEAYPHSINYWLNENGDMMVQSDKSFIITTDIGYHKSMVLEIKNIGLDDFRSYSCVAKNSLGETDGIIRLDQIQVTTIISLTNDTEELTDKLGHFEQDVLFTPESASPGTKILLILSLIFIEYLFLFLS